MAETPPAQYDELMSASKDGATAVLRERVEKLACDYAIDSNCFAWQAFARAYDIGNRQAIPAYLREDVYGVIRSRADRVEVHHASLIGFLAGQPAHSLHRYVLLDAQDWMTPDMLARLWTEIGRTAHAYDARIVFRTAGMDSPLPGKLPPELSVPWTYCARESMALHAKDRSTIYGGFHLYTRRAPS